MVNKDLKSCLAARCWNYIASVISLLMVYPSGVRVNPINDTSVRKNLGLKLLFFLAAA